MKEGPKDPTRRLFIKSAAALAVTALDSTEAEAQKRPQEQLPQPERPVWEQLRLTEAEYKKTENMRAEMTAAVVDLVVPFFRQVDTKDTKAYADFAELVLAGNAQEPMSGPYIVNFRALYSLYGNNPADAKPTDAFRNARAVLSQISGILRKEEHNIAVKGLKNDEKRVRDRLIQAGTKISEIATSKQ